MRNALILCFLCASIAAAQPAATAPASLLSSDPCNRNWVESPTEHQILFAAAKSTGEPVRIALVKSAVDGLRLTIDTDGPAFRLYSGFSTVEGAWNTRQGKTLLLGLSGDLPQLLVGGTELPALRGPWVALAKEKDRQMIIEIPGATYATIHYANPAAEEREKAEAEKAAEIAATRPAGPNGPWMITIAPKDDVASVKAQIDRYTADAKAAQDAMPNAQYDYDHQPRGSAAQADALTRIQALQSRIRMDQYNIDRLQRTGPTNPRLRLLNATLPDGTAVFVLAETPDGIKAADAMVAGRSYRVEGRMEKFGAKPRIRLIRVVEEPATVPVATGR